MRVGLARLITGESDNSISVVSEGESSHENGVTERERKPDRISTVGAAR